MSKLQVLTPWIGDGKSLETGYKPLISTLFDGRFDDVTSQPTVYLTPSPNMLCVQVTCAPTVADAIEADNRFYVLWREDE